MRIHKAYKYRIYPTCKQQEQFKHHFGCARWIYNYFLERKTKQYKESKKSETFLQMNKHFYNKRAEYPRFKNKYSKQSFRISNFFCKILENSIQAGQDAILQFLASFMAKPATAK
jgi:transposase